MMQTRSRISVVISHRQSNFVFSQYFVHVLSVYSNLIP